ncbi:putative protein S-acyltransferase 15 [Porphyridium purpureum]|uniref:Palmitoyltransferase n=1 Tax=Porphyridium purpureum TaxID=35688 RepID=A0A5J4YWZ8_PORPP|nr:putative protein S-acyltransferase 15 [Porphyridium purpureum]|eukprot:POR5526..scf209_3
MYTTTAQKVYSVNATGACFELSRARVASQVRVSPASWMIGGAAIVRMNRRMEKLSAVLELWYPGAQLAKWDTGWKKAGMIPLGAVLFTIGLGYYACLELLLRGNAQPLPVWMRLLVVLFHVDVFMLLWCLLVCVIVDAGPVPAQLRYTGDAYKPSQGHELLLVSEDGVVCAKKCHRCKSGKPVRAHHCRMCGKCVLRMDHHCLIINNCVGLHNHKFFVLFLGYAWLAVLFVTITCAAPLFRLLMSDARNIQAFGPAAMRIIAVACGWFTSAAYIFSLGALNAVQWYNLSYGVTTIETYDDDFKQRFAEYNSGWQNNLVSVFGFDPNLWLLPVRRGCSTTSLF